MKDTISRVIQPLWLGALVLTLVGCTSTENRYGRSEGRYIDDRKIASAIKNDLQQDPLYKFGQVYVTAYRGTVQLSGFALNEAQKQRAAEVALRTPGVASVENNISLAPADWDRARDIDNTRTNEGRQPVREKQTTTEPRDTTDPNLK